MTKNYELLISERQPTCGGKSPVKTEILTVSTDDPLSYVKAREPLCELEYSTDEDGTIIIKTQHHGLEIKYEFSED